MGLYFGLASGNLPWIRHDNLLYAYSSSWCCVKTGKRVSAPMARKLNTIARRAFKNWDRVKNIAEMRIKAREKRARADELRIDASKLDKKAIQLLKARR